MPNKIVITNETHMSLDISDIGVKLPGKGSSQIIDLTNIGKSAVFAEFKQKKWISCKPYRESHTMPHWPFHKVQAPPKLSDQHLINPIIPAAPKVPSFDSALTRPISQPKARPVVHVDESGTLGEIRDLLQLLVEKSPVSASPEVIAAHVASMISRQNGGPTPGAVHVAGTFDNAPQFVPSKIMPDKKLDLHIKTKSQNLNKDNFEDASLALKALKKKNDA